ncbi:MAG: FliH/SctL family protein [Thermodesulfobacteriota bacterium]
MSKIYHNKSGVSFERVGFHDLDAGGSAPDAFFVQRSPAEAQAPQPDSTAPEKTPEEKKAPAVDVEAIREEAYTKGRADGRQEAEAELHTAAQALAEGLEQISRLRESLLSKSKEDMVRLVMGVVGQVIQTEVTENTDIIVKTVTRALESAVASAEYFIKVHPDDLARVKEKEPLFLAAMKGLQNIYFIADESIARGGCLAESQAGDVDATIESQISEIYEHLRKEMG